MRKTHAKLSTKLIFQVTVRINDFILCPKCYVHIPERLRSLSSLQDGKYADDCCIISTKIADDKSQACWSPRVLIFDYNKIPRLEQHMNAPCVYLNSKNYSVSAPATNALKYFGEYSDSCGFKQQI